MKNTIILFILFLSVVLISCNGSLTDETPDPNPIVTKYKVTTYNKLGEVNKVVWLDNVGGLVTKDFQLSVFDRSHQEIYTTSLPYEVEKVRKRKNQFQELEK
jgi:hypothetical protein